MGRAFCTDDISSFIALHGFEGAAQIVAKVLEIPIDQAKKRVEIAQERNANEI